MGIQIFIAYIIDLLVGDPLKLPHPVVLMGRCISKLELYARRLFDFPRGLRLSGVLIVVTIVGASYGLTVLLLNLLSLLHPLLGYGVGIWLISTTIASRGLCQAGSDIYGLLTRGKINQAREKVSMVVGRDSNQMKTREITRATVETIAENTVDAVIAPLFYAFLAGPPAAIAYRAANTLDSMLGYKNDRYLYLGWAAAKFDDLVNYIPARLTGLFMLPAIWLTGRDAKEAVRSLLRYSSQHPSPNAGIPESVIAGALHIRLGGVNYYHGRQSFRAYMGPGDQIILPVHIRATIDLMFLTSFIFVLAGCILIYFWF